MRVIIITLVVKSINIKNVIYIINLIYIIYYTAVGNIRQWSKDWSSYLKWWKL